jgi:hypothetical protein
MWSRLGATRSGGFWFPPSSIKWRLDSRPSPTIKQFIIFLPFGCVEVVLDRSEAMEALPNAPWVIFECKEYK